MFDYEAQSLFVADYDATNDVLYIHLKGGNPNSYSIGNPAAIDGVDWLVAAQNPHHITGVIVQDWHKRWVKHHCMPPLPVPLTWDGTIPNLAVSSPKKDLQSLNNKRI